MLLSDTDVPETNAIAVHPYQSMTIEDVSPVVDGVDFLWDDALFFIPMAMVFDITFIHVFVFQETVVEYFLCMPCKCRVQLSVR